MFPDKFPEHVQAIVSQTTIFPILSVKLTKPHLREHVKTRHKRVARPMGVLCPLCKASFESQSLLSAHLKVPPQHRCEFRDEDPLDGFPPEREYQLPNFSKEQQFRTTQDKWARLWGFCFPEDRVGDIKSPGKSHLHSSIA
jgi:ribosomal protein L34E